MVQGINSIAALYQRYLTPQKAAGRISMPVKPAFSTFAVFKHILGVPAQGSNQSIPVYKLRILDSLIDRLVHLNGKNAISYEKLDVEKVDAMISEIQKQVSGANQSGGYSITSLVETGAIINVLA